jgi:hypothetical protein
MDYQEFHVGDKRRHLARAEKSFAVGIDPTHHFVTEA